jgi:hypothetical protein
MCIIIHSVIYNFKPELKIWKNYSVVKIIILLILIPWIIIIIIIIIIILWLIIYNKYFIGILQ